MKQKHRLMTACVISSLSLASITALNKLLFLSATHKKVLSTNSQTSSFFDWRFGRVYYTKSGHGKPLLLLHDLIPGSCGVEWEQIVSELSHVHTVYTLDLLGYGRSEKPAMTYTNYLYVQLLSDFIHSVIGRRTDIIASGSSCSLAIMSCHSDPSLFDHIMLINPDPLIKAGQTPGKRTKILKFLIESPIIGTLIYHIMTSRQTMREEFRSVYFASSSSISPRLIDFYHEASHLGDLGTKYTFSSLKGNYINFPISHGLAHIDNSIFIVGGEEETEFNKTLTEYEKLNPIIESNKVPFSKHFPQLENPKALLELCDIFFPINPAE